MACFPANSLSESFQWGILDWEGGGGAKRLAFFTERLMPAKRAEKRGINDSWIRYNTLVKGKSGKKINLRRGEAGPPGGPLVFAPAFSFLSLADLVDCLQCLLI